MTGSQPDQAGGSTSSHADCCLVTGATGFIGGHLTRRLVADGYRVRCLVRRGSDTAALEDLGVELAYGDLTDAGSLAGTAEDCRFVLHCGALVSDWATREEIGRVNVSGTRNVLDTAAAAAVQRFVHFSTTDVYGYPGGQAIDERQAPTGCGNLYAETKREAEAEVSRVAGKHGLEIVILRPATVYGPGSREVVGEMARALCARRMLLIGGGRTVAGLTYVANVVDAALLALRRDAAAGEAYNVTDGLDVTWRRFLGDLASGLGCSEPRWTVPYGVALALGASLERGYRVLHRASGLATRPLLSRQAVHVLGREQDFSNRKARDQLGWEPRVSYEDGLAATVEWLREGGLRG